ncbi:MAG: cytochrome c biogenesis protein CcsA [Gallionellaceae bacterium]|jgi:ABC-type uncharacterized transport system permease subunit|nr:cytochrome c biogenesis protein CcsA [Gallionellaceae bacterium]
MSNLSSSLSLYLFTFFAYGALAVYFWRAQVAGNSAAVSHGLIGHAVLLPLAVHGYLLYADIFAGNGLNFGLAYVVSLVLWLAVLVYWVARFFYPIDSLQTLVLPLVAASVLLPVLFPATHQVPGNLTVAFEAHILAAMLVYSLLTIAALHATLIAWVDRRLHHPTLPRVLRALPPLLTMETLLFRIVAVGFVLLTLTLLSGIVFSEQVFGKPWEFNHKILFGFISWFVFAGLLAGRHFYGWRGRKAIHWMMSGYVFLLLAYLGSKFVLEVLLHR